ncbi:MAG: hypothetical protein H6550_02665 [Chitinophagales bacterium]|nr:hypothetical protein [Chitinophagales bacterium]
MGIVERSFEPDIKKVHSTVYAELKALVSKDDFHYLTYESCHRCYAAYTDVRSFEKMLNNYRTRSLSIWVSRVFRKAGCSLPFSAEAPSYISVFLIVLILYRWLCGCYERYIAFAGAAAIMLLPGFSIIQNSADPGALSTMLTLLSLYLLANRKPVYIIAIAMLLSVFARVDNIVLVASYIAIEYFPRAKYVIILAVAGAVASSIAVHFNMLRSFPIPGGLSIYLENITNPTQWQHIYEAFMREGYYYFLFSSLLLLLFAPQQLKHIIRIVIMAATLHLLLFPVLEPRFFTAFNTVAIVLLAIFLNTLKSEMAENMPIACR